MSSVHRPLISNQLQQLVAGAAQVGPQAAGAAQLGAHDVPQVEAQQRGLQRRIFGQQSFGILKWQRGLQQLLQLLQQEATGAQVATGAQLATGAAQVGAQAGAQLAAGAQAGAAQVGAAEQHAAGAAQLGAELQLLQLLWWNRPAWALFMLAKAASAAEIQTNFIAILQVHHGPRERIELSDTGPNTKFGGRLNSRERIRVTPLFST